MHDLRNAQTIFSKSAKYFKTELDRKSKKVAKHSEILVYKNCLSTSVLLLRFQKSTKG